MTQGVGPCYTYHHTSLGNQSYIDHVCVSSDIIESISNTAVVQPHYLNISDHLPVTTTLQLHHSFSTTDHPYYIENESIPKYMWKNQLFLQNFKQRINDIKLVSDNNTPVTASIANLHESLKSCAFAAYNDLKKDSDFHFIDKK